MMRRPVDSLFGRLALLVVTVLFLTHFASYALIRLDRNRSQVRYAVEEMVFLINSVQQHVARQPDQPLPSRVKLIDQSDPKVPWPSTSLPAPLERFRNDVQDRLPAGTQIRIDRTAKPPNLWVLAPGSGHWILLPMQPLRAPRSVDRILFWLTFIFFGTVLSALFAAWQLQQPLRRLVHAVARFGRGMPVPPIPENGPRELRQLTRGFNQMVSDIERTESDRSIMLAGVAHDLKTPLARLRLRAEMVEETKLREGVVRDVDSLAHIVDQFLVFAHDSSDQSEPAAVDSQCERFARNYRAVAPNADPVELDLQAGADFRLPAASLERMLSNLLDNAHAYGVPPISIATRRVGGDWELSVSDHGSGISPQDLLSATRPFVRLDPARGGNGHSGLGLAIVQRLVRGAGGECIIGNLPEGGLRVALRFPGNGSGSRNRTLERGLQAGSGGRPRK